MYLSQCCRWSYPKTDESTRPTILDKVKWNSKPPSHQIKDEAARRAKTRHFPILDLGRVGGSRFSIYFAQDFRVSCFHVSSVSRCLELVMKLPPSFLTYYMKLNGVHLVIPSISNSVFKQAFKLTLKLQEINNYTFRSNLQLFFTASSHFEIPSLGCKLQRVKILSVELGRVTVLSPTQAK